MENFNIKFADEIFSITCVQPNTRTLCADFLTEETGIHFQATRAQKADIRERLSKAKHQNSIPPEEFSPSAVEMFAIHDFVAHELVKRGVLLVHGSAVVVNGKAVMVIAPSGTGKSTHTHLWTQLPGKNAFIINDDKQMIRLTGEQPVVHATPWGMVMPAPAVREAPLGAIIWLRRGENHIEPISEKQMFPELYKASLHGATPAETVQILQLQQRLIHSVPLFAMTCKPELAAAQMAYEAVFGNQ